MRLRHFVCLFGLSVFLGASLASAGLKPAQVKAKMESEKGAMAELAAMNKLCGSKVEATMDFSKWGGDWSTWTPSKPGDICGHVMQGVEALCRDAAYKPAVAENLKKIECSCDGTTDPVQKNLSYSGGTIHFKMNVKHDNSATLESQHFLAAELNK